MFYLLLPMYLLAASGTQAMEIPMAESIIVDGIAGDTEWADAAQLVIPIKEGWQTDVYIQRDDRGIAIRFNGVISTEKEERYPEVMFNIGNRREKGWDSNDYWFHISYSDCFQQGRHSIWDCEEVIEGMTANNFPISEGECVEVHIPYETLGIRADYSGEIGLCFNLTDTHTEHTFWPAGASIDEPASWASATFQMN